MLDELDAKSLQAKGWDHYVDMCRRRRWWLILPVFVVWGTVWAISWFLPVAYNSQTLILVEKQCPSNMFSQTWSVIFRADCKP